MHRRPQTRLGVSTFNKFASTIHNNHCTYIYALW